jgi:hypothetical protein
MNIYIKQGQGMRIQAAIARARYYKYRRSGLHSVAGNTMPSSRQPVEAEAHARFQQNSISG